MSNWFSNHPATSVIGHTLIVAAGVWAFSVFVLDDNKVNLYKAQVDNSKTIAEQYMQKVSSLESEIVKLKAENERYLAWLTSEPKSFPALSLKITTLERDLDAAKLASQNREPHEIEPPVSLYEFSKDFSKGESFTDPKTKAVIGISYISPSYTAVGVVALPDGKKIEIENGKPGDSWDFKKSGKSYRLTLDSVNWINNTLKASVSETSE